MLQMQQAQALQRIQNEEMALMRQKQVVSPPSVRGNEMSETHSVNGHQQEIRHEGEYQPIEQLRKQRDS